MMERINITVDTETLRKLHKICELMDRTPSGTVRQLIKEYKLDE